MADYFSEINLFERHLKQIGKICQTMEYQSHCKRLILHLENNFQQMENHRDLIQAFNRRNKRAIKFVGRVYNIFFGLLDSESAEKYDSQIKNLEDNDLKIKNLMEEQFIIAKNSIQMVNSTFSEVKRNLALLKKKLNEYMDSSENKAWFRNNFNNLFQSISLILVNNIRLTESITDILSNSIQGKISNFIPVNVFKRHLEEIEFALKKGQKKPFDLHKSNMYNILRVLKIKSALYNRKILIEVTVPIIRISEYNLYKGIPIPYLVRDELVIVDPDNKYFLINTASGKYIPMTEEDINNCIENDEKLICSPSMPIYVNKRNHCTLSLFLDTEQRNILQKCKIKKIPRDNYFIALNDMNNYYVYIDKPFTVRINCAGRETEVFQLKESGRFALESECVLRTDEWEISARFTKDFGNILLNTPKINLTDFEAIKVNLNRTKNNKSILEFNDFGKDFIQIQKHVEMLEEKTKEVTIEKLSNNFVGSLGTEITIIIVIIIFLILILLKIIKIFVK